MHIMYQSGDWGGLELLGMGTFPFFGVLPLLVWSLVWKGWALWLAARRGELVWFLVLLVVNTLGALEIFYIFVIAKQQDTREEAGATTTSKKEKDAAEPAESTAT